ncbi:MAG TPA: GNAT family N-acetyltransferase [Syntrophales bacterium]|nr:GNAT family N-acetyltransferase [Syntrophales bacterium]
MKSQEKDEPGSRRKKPEINIREMDIDDIAHVFHLGEKLFKAQEVPNLYRTWDEFEVIQLYQSDSDLCFIAEEEDTEKIIGFVLGTTVTKSHSAWKYGLMVWMGVDPAYRRYAVATRLFNELTEAMLEEGVRMLLVDTEADNLEALHFFRKMGFGNPQEHLYLTLNLAAKLKQWKEKANGKPKPNDR